MADKTDLELVEICGPSKNEYQESAVEVAQKELDRRQLKEETIKRLKREIRIKRKQEASRIRIPLEIHLKFFCFIIPGLIYLMIKNNLMRNGLDRKLKEAKTLSLYGLGFYMGLLLIWMMIGAF